MVQMSSLPSEVTHVPGSLVMEKGGIFFSYICCLFEAYVQGQDKPALYLVPVLSPSQRAVVQSLQYLVSSPNLYASEGRSVVPRVLVTASEVSESCLHFLRDRSYWLVCVCDRKIHSLARLHLLENTVLLDNHSTGKPLSGQEEYSTLVHQMPFS